MARSLLIPEPQQATGVLEAAQSSEEGVRQVGRPGEPPACCPEPLQEGGLAGPQLRALGRQMPSPVRAASARDRLPGGRLSPQTHPVGTHRPGPRPFWDSAAQLPNNSASLSCLILPPPPPYPSSPPLPSTGAAPGASPVNPLQFVSISGRLPRESSRDKHPARGAWGPTAQVCSPNCSQRGCRGCGFRLCCPELVSFWGLLCLEGEPVGASPAGRDYLVPSCLSPQAPWGQGAGL